jgi:hypothetical protein
MKRFSLLILLLILTSAATFGQKKGEMSPYIQYPGPESGTYEKARVPLGSEVTEAAVLSAVLQRYPELEGAQNGLEVLHKIPSPGGLHYTLGQTYQEIPLYNSGVKVNLDPAGTIISFMNWLSFSPKKIKGAFKYTPEQAIAQVKRTLNRGEEITHVWADAAWYPTDRCLIPVYVVQTEGIGYQCHWEFVLEANSLKEVLRKERATYCRPKTPPPPPTVNGRGFVFDPDPITSDQTFYASSWEYTDRDDSLSPALDNARILVTLKEITEDNGVYTLEGPYVTINDFELPVIPPATSTNGDFFAQRSDPMFEDVMCYFHIDSLQRFVQKMGFSNLSNLQVRVDPHGLDSADNSHFVAPNQLAFGQGGVDDAEDADVIVHEYGHALSYSGSPGTNVGYERKGLDEGYGDYISAMWSYGIDPYSWGNIFSWDGHNEFWLGRSAQATYTYPPPTGANGFYAYGELWATALMEAHNHPNIGRWVTNKCVFESMYGNAVNGTLQDGAQLILDADSIFYNEAHEAEFRAIFCNYQILSGQQCNVVLGQDDLGMGLGIAVYPNPTREFVNITLEGYQPGMEVEVLVVSLTGQVLMQEAVYGPQHRMDTHTLGQGVYLLQIQNSQGVLKTEKLVIR